MWPNLRPIVGWADKPNNIANYETKPSMQYRRSTIQGACYFFTVVLADRKQDLLIRHVGILRESLCRIRQRHPFEIVAIVVLPDHLHAIWRLPDGDADFALRWNLIKGRFSRSIPLEETISTSRQRKRERGIWQRRYWEHLIRDEADLAAHVDYIHYNPVKHGYVNRAADWPYSSIHRYIRHGYLHAGWGGVDPSALQNTFGE